MRDTRLIVPNRAVELFADSFERLFVKPLPQRIADASRRRQVARTVGEISDAAALGLARFLSGEPPEGVDIDSLFEAVGTALAALSPNDVWPPEGSPEARAQHIGGSARSPDWQPAQTARFGVALELVVAALWQAGEVLHAWGQVQFAAGYEPPRQFVERLRELGTRQVGLSTPPTTDLDDETFELRYRDYVLRRWGRLDVGTLRAASALSVGVGDLFVMPRVARKEKETGPAEEVLFDNQHRVTALIGPPGSGKSTLLLWLQQQVVACKREHILGEGQALPVLVRARELQAVSEQEMGENRRIVELATGSRDLAALMPEGWLDRQFASGQVLLLLDGLDETESSIRDGVLFPWLAGLLESEPVWRVVITSRPAGFAEAEFASAKGAPTKGMFLAWHPVLYTLQEFGPDEVALYLRNWCTQVRIAENEPAAEAAVHGREEAEAIVESVRRHQAVKELARTPLLLSAICLVYRFEGGRLPDDRAALYRLCVEGLLDRWDAQKGLRSPFTPEVKLRVCRELAAWMMKARIATCTYAEAKAVVGSVLGSAASADELLGHVLNRAGLIIERQPGLLSFAHLTFQEYLAALAVRDENAQGLTPATLAKNHVDGWFREVILLFARLAPPVLVRQLLGLIRSVVLRLEPNALSADRYRALRDHCSLLFALMRASPPEVVNDPGVRREVLAHLLSCAIGKYEEYEWWAITYLVQADRFRDAEIAEALRSGFGLGQCVVTRPLQWTWASKWCLDHQTEWPSVADRRTLEQWREVPPHALSQAIFRYYSLSPREELVTNGLYPEFWRAPLSTDPCFKGPLQIESVMAGISQRVRKPHHAIGTVDVLQTIPERLLVEVVECCGESRWPESGRESDHYSLFNRFVLKPSTDVLKTRFIAAFQSLADSLGESPPAVGLRRWISAASTS